MREFVPILFFVVVLSFNLYSQVDDFRNSDFRKADSVAILFRNHPINDLKGLAEKLTSPFSKEEEKFRAIFYWVCHNIEGDYPYYLKNERQRTKFERQPEALQLWNDEFSKQVFTRLLNHKKTVCTGYAYLVKALSTWAGLSCEIVDGYGRSVGANVGGEGKPNHSWNAVQLNAKWYLSDATWSSGIIEPVSGVFFKQFEEAYFLTAPDVFVQNHFPLDTAWVLVKDKPVLRDFLNGPIIYKSAIQYAAKPVAPSTFIVKATKRQNITFKFYVSNGQTLKKVALQVNGKTIMGDINMGIFGVYSIDYQFKTRGKYIVHLLLNSTYAFTYLVEVS